MNQCLRCKKPCDPSSLFCDECRLVLQDSHRDEGMEARQEEIEQQVVGAGVGVSGVSGAMATVVMPLLTLPSLAKKRRQDSRQGEQQAGEDEVSKRDTAPIPVVRTSLKLPDELNATSNIVEQAIARLTDAARHIAAGEPGMSHGLHVPRASRLTPLRDISADIQRKSTPLPKTASGPLQRSPSDDLGKRMPDLWPWLHDDSEESPAAPWANYTDPLLSRRIPSSQEEARIEEEDMRRAIAQGLMAPPRRRTGKMRRRVNQLRLAFICLAAMAIIALGIDSVLVSAVLLHNPRPTVKVSGPPTLTISLAGHNQLGNVVGLGQSLDLHLRHFTPSSFVFLTHDVGELVQTNLDTPLFRVDQNGSADVTTVIDNSWEPGFHTIQAEDRTTHYTATATLQITSGKTQPSHLEVRTNELDMGAAPVGANTVQALTLYNQGTGSLIWSANSNSPWLMLTPNQGTFSISQTIAVGVERTGLKVGNYTGKITFTSNVGDHINVLVTMGVQPVQEGMAALAITPAVLSFDALDNGPDPSTQFLMVSNPGSRPLHWSLSSNAATALGGQGSFLGAMGQSTSWLSLSQNTGVVAPGQTQMVTVIVHSHTLLPGTYINTLLFTGAQGTTNSPQNVTVSLTVEPSCGLVLNTGGLSFTAISGQASPNNQALTLSSTPSCPNLVSWQASTSAGWLNVTPLSGQIVKGMANTVLTVSVDTQGMPVGTQTGSVWITAGQNTQTVLVTVTIQPPLAPSAPVMGVSQLSLNFSTTQGQSSPPGQLVTITNTTGAGGSTLSWHTAVTQLASAWLGASPAYGTVAPGQTGQLTVDVNTSSLTPGNYVGQVQLIGTDGNGHNAGRSPQTIMVNLLVLPPCTLAAPSSSVLVFAASQGGAAPSPQSVTLTAAGNCAWPLTLKVNVPATASWLKVSPATVTIGASGQSTTLTVAPTIAGLSPNSYTASVAVTATDASNAVAQGSPQTFGVTLNITQPCSVQVAAGGLSFTLTQGQGVPTQALNFSETGSCARPVSWTATPDNGSASWLTLSATSGTDNGSGSSIGVGVNPSLTPGTYNGSITLTLTDANGVAVQSSPQTIPVLVTVSGFTVGGVVEACAANPCAAPLALAGATVTLTDAHGTKIGTLNANSNGNFSFTNIAAGTYTLSATGTDTASLQYSGSVSITVTGNSTNLTLNAYALQSQGITPTPTS
jgi:hypothetical protein